MTIALNGVIPCTTAHVTMPAIGAWVVDLEVDLELVPPGPAVLTIGLGSLQGRIDDAATGSNGPTGRARLVGGLGWSKNVPAVHIHNDAGVLTSAVLAVTAAEVLEVVIDAVPKLVGVDFVRCEGPASRVLAGLDWYVNEAGVTIVGPRIPTPATPDVEILNWDPQEKLAELYSTSLVIPGTVLTDARFGIATVRDVEQTFTAEGGARAKAWCVVGAPDLLPGAERSVGGLKLVRMLSALAREAVGLPFLRRHPYRVVSVNVDGRLVLASTALLPQTPRLLTLVPVWSGVAGASQKPVPGTVVTVAFIGGVPSQPVVVGFDPIAPPPLELKFDAVRIALGLLAVDPVAKAPGTLTALGAIQAELVALGVWLSANLATSFSAGGLVATTPTLVSAIAAGTTAVTAASALVPSPKSFTD